MIWVPNYAKIYLVNSNQTIYVYKKLNCKNITPRISGFLMWSINNTYTNY